MLYEGVIRKMRTEDGKPVQYLWELGSDFLQMNQTQGKKLEIKHLKNECLNCGQDRPIFRMGYCQSCFFEVPQTGEWLIKPELSTAHLDQADRDLAYEKQIQLQPHIVYLADTGGVKVGVTRKTQVPTRWFDQGASRALPVVETPNRYLAGVAEVALKERVSDKTVPARMLTDVRSEESLETCWEELKTLLPEEVRPYEIENPEARDIAFPVREYPAKIKSFRLDSQPEFSGTLVGIRGQYLIFESQLALNLRGHEGYYIGLNIR